MSNENDDATQLGSIGRHMSKPQQPGNPPGTPRIPSSKPADASAGTGRRRRGHGTQHA